MFFSCKVVAGSEKHSRRHEGNEIDDKCAPDLREEREKHLSPINGRLSSSFIRVKIFGLREMCVIEIGV